MARGDSRIFIETEGGLVTAVWADDPDACVTIINSDWLEDGDEDEQAHHAELIAELEDLKQNELIGQVY